MREHYFRLSLRWGLIVVAVHWILSLPFFYVGPMLTTPSHGGVIGWVWSVLQFPAIVFVTTLGLTSVGFSASSLMGEFATL